MSISETDSEMKVAQACPTLCNSMDYPVHGILQARILQWVAFPFSRETSQLRDQTQVSCIVGGFFCSWATREAQNSQSQRRSQILDLEIFLLNEGVLFTIINQLPYVDNIFILSVSHILFFFFLTKLVTNYKLSCRSHLKAALLFCYSLLTASQRVWFP